MASSPRVEASVASGSDEVGRLAGGNARAVVDGSVLTIQGWVVGRSSPIREIEIVDADSRPITRAPVDMPRPDLAEGFGDRAAATAGFRVVLEARRAGRAELGVRAMTGAGFAPLASLDVELEAADDGSRPTLLRRLRSRRGGSWSVLSLSGESEKVLEGREGWLFLRRDTNDVIGQHTGRVSLSSDQRDAWAEVLARRLATAESLGVRWLCAVIPDKESIYPEQLPKTIVPAPRRPVHDLLDVAAEAGAPVLYALQDLERRKDEWDLYPKTDTHWSHRGAYVVYRAICERLGEGGLLVDPVGEESIEWTDEEHPGDLGGKLHPPVASSMPRARLSEHHGRLVFDNGLRNHGRVLIFERLDGAGPTCVVFGESFAENMLIFLKETFGRLVVVHTSMFVEEVVERERPDVVLSLPLERFLVRVPDDADALLRLSETARGKGGEVPWTP